jgi:AAA family ATP:ADP antiporter
MTEAKTRAQRLLGRIANVQPQEVATVLAAFLLFFFVLGSYFAVRPVRETVGTILGRSRTADLYVWTWVFSIAIIPLYGALVARFRRSVFLPWIYGFVALSLGGVGFAFSVDEQNMAVGQFFYVWISVLNLFIMSVFWSFLLEIFDSAQSKRLFGFIAAGGTAGALAGPTITSIVVPMIHNSGVLFMGAGGFVIAVLCQRSLLHSWHGAAGPSSAASMTAVAQERAIGGNPFAGFTLVLRSPYLLGIACFVALAASATTFLYFEQLRIVEATFADTSRRTQVFSILDAVVQSFAIFAQLFLTGRIASRLGLVVLLAIVPVTMVFGFAALAATGTFAVLAVVFVLRRAGEYAFVRIGREMLFSRVDNETRYKAKSLIDVPVYRGADAITAQLKDAIENAGLTASLVAMLGSCVAAFWAINGWWLGRRADRDEAARHAAQSRAA